MSQNRGYVQSWSAGHEILFPTSTKTTISVVKCVRSTVDRLCDV